MGFVTVTVDPEGTDNSVAGGNINVVPPSFDWINLSATPASDYVFTHWSGLDWQPTEVLHRVPLILLVGEVMTDDYDTPVTDPEISVHYPYFGSPLDDDPGLNITAHFSSTIVDPHGIEVVLSSVPSTIDVTLTGGGTYGTSPNFPEWPYTITISAPPDVQNYAFSHWDGQFWTKNQELFPDNTLPSQTFTIPEDTAASMLRMRANYELVDYADTETEDTETEFEYQLTIRELDIANINIDDVTTEQYAIIEERFGGLVYGQNNIDFEFRELLPYVENEPVN
ncbi:hypothetical protein CMI47_20790, partial [Candidatus Pacearchaeota archaeon]|nr:hypothetical protein [Candidatus Pacearchaeota archaeon]